MSSINNKIINHRIIKFEYFLFTSIGISLSMWPTSWKFFNISLSYPIYFVLFLSIIFFLFSHDNKINQTEIMPKKQLWF